MSSTSQNAAASMMPGNSNLGNTMMMANPMVGGAMMAGHLFSHRKQIVTEVWTIAGPKSETVIMGLRPRRIERELALTFPSVLPYATHKSARPANVSTNGTKTTWRLRLERP